MFRALIAAMLMFSAPQAAAQQVDGEAGLVSTAIEQICNPFVRDRVAEADIAALRGVAYRALQYHLSDDVSVSLSEYGQARVCFVNIIDPEHGDAYRAAMFDAASQQGLEYRGDIEPAGRLIRHEVFCPTSRAAIWWSVMTRDSAIKLALGIASGGSRHCSH